MSSHNSNLEIPSSHKILNLQQPPDLPPPRTFFCIRRSILKNVYEIRRGEQRPKKRTQEEGDKWDDDNSR